MFKETSEIFCMADDFYKFLDVFCLDNMKNAIIYHLDNYKNRLVFTLDYR